ncbi:NAD(P)H-binding protein [Sphingobium sufflavum]|uniref:NAD-dependent epimerase/dehydratase family protein n=1 Tax=Sphingobium sufflavum TaxID=1129547 RepID=UPI001F22D12F|nr:NAD(P)H-binding protein [Sphingobium sufflavum]MCE7795017.1 NAD(P)H-binding protein [Sphingobium sufflavum]
MDGARRMIVALTGATGFLGGAVLERLIADGHGVRALTRRPQPERPGVAWIAGDLADEPALASLVAGTDAVIHVAGAVNVPGRAAFFAANAEGTRVLVEQAQAAGVTRFVLVSSLSAREPQLSDYGWSKREGERMVEAGTLDWTIVRPPAIYGPGDREMLEMFQMAARGLVMLPPTGRLSVIHADDLAGLLVLLAGDRSGLSTGATYEVDDGAPGGFSHVDFAHALGRAVGRRAFALSLPRLALMLGARVDGLLRGKGAKLTADRVRYFCHPDWVAAPDRRVPESLWRAGIAVEQGLTATAAAYRAKGWLK